MRKRNIIMVTVLALILSIFAIKADTKAASKIRAYSGYAGYDGAYVKVTKNYLTIRGEVDLLTTRKNGRYECKVGKTRYYLSGKTKRLKKRTYKIAKNCVGVHWHFSEKKGCLTHKVKRNFRKYYNRYKKMKYATPTGIFSVSTFNVVIKNNKVVYIECCPDV